MLSYGLISYRIKFGMNQKYSNNVAIGDLVKLRLNRPCFHRETCELVD